LIDRCEQLGLVERRPGREDRRQIEVHLLSEGAKRVAQIADMHQPELRQLQKEIRLPDWKGRV